MSDIQLSGSRKRRPLSQLALSEVSLTPSKRPKLLNRRAGTILKICLKNFMCHSLLNVDLRKNVNLIVGRNGSGKSAILTALVVGLGGKASLTNRGTSVKNFIKAGKTSGSIEIELYNGGSMGYRPSVYGDRIIITRHFNANGSSSYCIKSDNGEVKSRAFREVINITTALYIQVDNPVCILNQDTSRNFLMSSDPKHKFQLFMKATKLDTLAEEYRKLRSNKEEAIRSFEEKQDSYKKLLTEINEVKIKIDDHKSIIGMKAKLRETNCELLWARVRDCQEEMEKVVEKIDDFEGKLAEAVDAGKNRVARVEEIKNHIKELRAQLDEQLGNLTAQRQLENDQKRVIEQLETKYNDHKVTRARINSTIQSKTRDTKELDEQISGVNERAAQAEREKLERVREFTKMKEKLKAIEEHLVTSTSELHILQGSNEMAERQQDLRQEITRLDREIRNETNTLNALRGETGNNLLLYGPDMPRIVETIERNRNRFKQLPRGPLGNYIKLKDKRWAVAIEGFLSAKTLGAFTVDNPKDNLILQDIFNRNCTQGHKPNIITSQFYNRKHNIGQNMVSVPSDCASICDSLEIEDPIVFNCMIDQSNMESVLLIPNGERAIELMSNANKVPRKCSQALTMSGDVFFPMPRYRTYASRNARARYLQVDTKEYMNQLEAKIAELEAKKSEKQAELQKINSQMQNHEKQKSDMQERVKKLLAAKTQMRRHLDQLNIATEPEVASVEFLETELMEVKATLKAKQSELVTIQAAMQEVKKEIDVNRDKLKELKDASAAINVKIQGIESEIQEEKARQGEISTGGAYDKRKIDEINNKLGQVRAELLVKEMHLKECTDEASTIGAKIETQRSIGDIMQQINKLERRVKKIQNGSVNVEELTKSYNEMHEKASMVSRLLTLINQDIVMLTKNVADRARHYKLTEDYFKVYIQETFKQIMEARQFRGSIKINMLNQTLDMVVIPQHGSQGLTTTSNLSGGERSFSTVAFLYSLWQCMEFPFYFLDEFDVYMDKLNRSKVIEILLHHAMEHAELQFVFLTPQDVPAVKNDVCVLRLDDPERIPV